MPILTPVQVVATIKDVDNRLNGGKMTNTQLLTATYIVLRESGGVTNVRGVQDPDDRGLWQWNRRYHPDISDMQADDPKQATEIAFRKSNGWTDFSPWNANGTNGKTTGNPEDIISNKNKYWNKTAWQTAIQAVMDSGISIVGDSVYEDITQAPVDAVNTAIDAVVDPLAAVGQFLGKLMSATFWKRIGIGALGLAIILVALVLFLSKSDTVKEVAGEVTPNV